MKTHGHGQPAGRLLFLGWLCLFLPDQLALGNSISLRPGAVSAHWAFQPPVRPEVPVLEDEEWPRNPIDAFVLARLIEEGLEPSPPADRVTLIRRLTYGLHGLPPTPGEISAFVADESPDAAGRLIERLLASPRYGERWARHWLDAVRFCESQGFERDKLREHSWRYRDYVIGSFNSDKPYPQFAREQLAGDLIEPVTREGIIATGFLVAGPWDEVGANQAGAVMKARVREDELEDMVAVTGQTFLGLTIQCARCHDHVYDPISLPDYYRFKAAFEGVHHGDRAVLTPDEQALLAIAIIEETPHPREDQQAGAMPIAYAANPRQPEPSRVLLRGDVQRPGPVIAPGGLKALASLNPDFGLSPDAPEGERRLKMAEWIASPDNPLLARVLVNRVWHHHFGRGLVGTPNDFGRNGERPSHPELLDWLAEEFKRHGWSVKELHRLILRSNTYQQSAEFNSHAATVDGENRLLWRFTPRRLEAEAVRDGMLAISGQLNDRMGGPGYRPFDLQINNSWFYTWADHQGDDFNRRTVYRINVQSARDPVLDALDCPDMATITPVRSVTTTPLQALALMNNSFVLRQVDHFARRVKAGAGERISAQVHLAWQLALGRIPREDEMIHAMDLAREHGLESVCWALFNSTEFLYVR